MENNILYFVVIVYVVFYKSCNKFKGYFGKWE